MDFSEDTDSLLLEKIQNPEKTSSEKPDKNTDVSSESKSIEETAGWNPFKFKGFFS